MGKFENFFVGDKSYTVPVIDLSLTEEKSDETSLNRFAQKEIRGEKGIFVKRLFGVLFVIAAINRSSVEKIPTS